MRLRTRSLFGFLIGSVFWAGLALQLGCGKDEGFAGPSDIYRYRAYVADTTGGTIASLELVLLTGLLNPLNTYEAGVSPTLLRLHPNGKWLYYVDDANRNANSGKIGGFSIDLFSGGLTPISSESARLSRPRGLAIHPGGENLYTVGYSQDSLIRYRIQPDSGNLTGQELVTVPGGSPTDLAINAEGTYLYVTSYLTDQVHVYALSAEGEPSWLSTVYAGDPASSSEVLLPTSVAVSPQSGLVFISASVPSQINVMRPSGGGLTYVGKVASHTTEAAGALSFSPLSSELYVLDRRNGVTVFSVNEAAGSLELRSNYDMGDIPSGVFLGDLTGSWVFATAGGSVNSLFVYQRDSTSGVLNLAGEISVGSSASSVVAVSAKLGW